MEMDFVVTPFLPGDSLIFATGTFATLGSLNIWLLFVLLVFAAVVGDTVNYWVDHDLGERAYNIIWIKLAYLDRTHTFFEKSGRKTISERRRYRLVSVLPTPGRRFRLHIAR